MFNSKEYENMTVLQAYQKGYKDGQKMVVEHMRLLEEEKSTAMSLKEFFEYLERQTIGTKIVYMRYKYSFETEWTYDNEILDVNSDLEYEWFNDWNEGQQCVEILGCIDLDDVKVPLFKKGAEE